MHLTQTPSEAPPHYFSSAMPETPRVLPVEQRPIYASRSHSSFSSISGLTSLRRHSSLADITRMRKTQQHCTNDISRFYDTETDTNPIETDQLKQFSRYNTSASTEYLLNSPSQVSISDNSNFIYRTGSHLFGHSKEDLDSLPSRIMSKDSDTEDDLLFIGRGEMSDSEDEKAEGSEENVFWQRIWSIFTVKMLQIDIEQENNQVEDHEEEITEEEITEVCDPAVFLAILVAYFI